jgi:hypothetical protein
MAYQMAYRDTRYFSEIVLEFLGDLGKEKKGYSGALFASMMANEASFVNIRIKVRM